MSSLPIAQFCAQAPVLAGAAGGGRAAAMGTAFHALACGQDASAALARLTPEEAADVMTPHHPTPLEVPGLAPLSYSDAEHEVALALDDFGGWSDPEGAAEGRLTLGHADAIWVVGDAVVVADLKRSRHSHLARPDSLQLVAYALGAMARERDRGRTPARWLTAIWDCTEGEWLVGEWHDAAHPDTDALWHRVAFAATNVGDNLSPGAHCRDCYGRTRCPAYAVSPEVAGDALSRLSTGELDAAGQLALLRMVERVDDSLETAKKLLKDAARRGGIPSEDGAKVWLPVLQNGRESLDTKALGKDHPELVAKYRKRGAPFETFRWVNRK